MSYKKNCELCNGTGVVEPESGDPILDKPYPCTCNQEDCDHEFEVIDDSFDHEYGTEQIVFQRCKLCDVERDYEPPHFDDNVI